MHWNEAQPIGNGRMGAMVFGGVTNERVQRTKLVPTCPSASHVCWTKPSPIW